MPLKGTMRDVLEIDEGTLSPQHWQKFQARSIKNTVQKFGKESLGPQKLRPALEEGNSYVFKIVECTVFEGSCEFSCGMSIKATMIKQLSDSDY